MYSNFARSFALICHKARSLTCPTPPASKSKRQRRTPPNSSEHRNPSPKSSLSPSCSTRSGQIAPPHFQVHTQTQLSRIEASSNSPCRFREQSAAPSDARRLELVISPRVATFLLQGSLARFTRSPERQLKILLGGDENYLSGKLGEVSSLSELHISSCRLD